MSERVGNSIPPPLRFELGAEQGTDQLCRAVLLATTDDDGSPRVAVLSYGEVRPVDDRRLTIAVNAGTRTHHNMQAARDATLWCVLDGAAYSLRGRVSASPGPAAAPERGSGRFGTFELAVEEVLRDFYPEAPMMSGPTYRRLG